MDFYSSNELSSSRTHLIAQARKKEVQTICDAIAKNKNVIVVGATGSGRQPLVEFAVRKANVKIIKVDCIQAASRRRLVEIFGAGLHQAFCEEENIQQVIQSSPPPLSRLIAKALTDLTLEEIGLADDASNKQIFDFAKKFIDAAEYLAEGCDTRVVIMLKNVAHIQSWDRENKWYKAFAKKIVDHKHVNYVRIATFGESQVIDEEIANSKNSSSEKPVPEIIKLAQLDKTSLLSWALLELKDMKLVFNPLEDGLDQFLNIVQGHFGDTLTLIRRLKMLSPANVTSQSLVEIGEQDVEDALNSVLEDFDFVFEALLLLLPNTQTRLLECLVLDPTKKPHSAAYANKHELPRGGTIQGALKGLEKKGLIYDTDNDYAIAMPLLAQWIKKQRTKVTGTGIS